MSLQKTGHAEAPRLFIHGDFTTDNILIDGEPPTIVGAIDFALTNREVALADVALGLWRSGRPESQAMTLDPARVAALVAGYASRRKHPGGDCARPACLPESSRSPAHRPCNTSWCD